MPAILLVDDDEPMRKMLGITLTKLGYQVTEARDGREALRLFAAEPPDLVLTDMVMPDKEGVEVIGELRRLQPDLKIIAMSGGGRGDATDYLKVARLMGAAHTLHKPFSTADLTDAIDSLLGPPSD